MMSTLTRGHHSFTLGISQFNDRLLTGFGFLKKVRNLMCDADGKVAISNIKTHKSILTNVIIASIHFLGPAEPEIERGVIYRPFSLLAIISR